MLHVQFTKMSTRDAGFSLKYAAYSGDTSPTLRSNLFFEVGTDRMSRNVGKELPLYAA